MNYKTYVCTDHDSHYPVGCASIVVARDTRHAIRLLDKELKKHGLMPYVECPYTFDEIGQEDGCATVLLSGDY